MLGLAAGAWLVLHHTSRLGLADALSRVGFHGFGGTKTAGLAFRHGKVEYEGDYIVLKVAFRQIVLWPPRNLE
ncbi:MAG TPA: hypothetical protein VG844_11865 [Terracidiphilus sp.]|nr:hypothetical protein [Terracidiphilus sp.]